MEQNIKTFASALLSSNLDLINIDVNETFVEFRPATRAIYKAAREIIRDLHQEDVLVISRPTFKSFKVSLV